MHHSHLYNGFSKYFRWFFSTLSIKIDIHVIEPQNEKRCTYAKEFLNLNKLVI